MGRALHKGRRGRQVPRSTWRWPELLGPCDDGVQLQPRWPGAQARRVPVWGKHLLPRAPPGPQFERTATLLYTPQVPNRAPLVLFFPAWRLGSVGHRLPLPLTHLRFLLLRGGVPGPPLSSLSPNNFSHIPWALLWCGFTSEGQKHRLYFEDIASPPGPKEKKKKPFLFNLKSSKKLQSFYTCFSVEELVLLALLLFTDGEGEAYRRRCLT